MKTTDFIRKILLPHEFTTFYFWGSLLKSIAPAVAGTAASYFLGGGKEAGKSMDRSADATQQQSDIAQQQWNRYQQIYAPVEEQLIAKAQQGITPDIDGVTGRANADVTQAYDVTRESTNRTLGRYGINPNSGRFVDTNRKLDIAEAGDKAGLINRSRENEINRAEDVGFARMASVVNTGRGIPSSVSANLSSVANSYSNQAQTYGQSAGGTAEFVAGLPWNDLFNSNKTPGTSSAIPTNTI